PPSSGVYAKRPSESRLKSITSTFVRLNHTGAPRSSRIAVNDPYGTCPNPNVVRYQPGVVGPVRCTSSAGKSGGTHRKKYVVRVVPRTRSTVVSASGAATTSMSPAACDTPLTRALTPGSTSRCNVSDVSVASHTIAWSLPAGGEGGEQARPG